MSETNAERLERIKEIHEKANMNYHADEFSEMKINLELLFMEEDTDWLIEEAERVQELEELKTHYMLQIQDLTRFNDKGIKENTRLREALDFYADKENYEVNTTDQWEPLIPIIQDNGEKARQTVGEKNAHCS